MSRSFEAPLIRDLIRFRGEMQKDPIPGAAHQGIARCPTPNSRGVSRATIGFQKLVEFGTVSFEERFSVFDQPRCVRGVGVTKVLNRMSRYDDSGEFEVPIAARFPLDDIGQ
jgi:hypothetical protein